MSLLKDLLDVFGMGVYKGKSGTYIKGNKGKKNGTTYGYISKDGKKKGGKWFE